MKLRNKKTGEIGELLCNPRVIDIYFVANDEGNYSYNSLSELNEEWEDYKEPEDVWYIDWKGDVRVADGITNDWSKEKEIGNYFETKEEAEKAVEKLKAWKRLKDNGFKFKGWAETDAGKISIYTQYKYINDIRYFDQISHNLDLLFGGEE